MDCSMPGLPVHHLTPGACSNSCPSSEWCHPTNSSSVVPFSSCLQSFPASGSFPMSQFFTSGGQSIGDLANIWKQPNTFNRWMFKLYVIYMYEYYSVIEKNETLPFVIWNIQSIMLSEMSEKDKYYMNSLQHSRLPCPSLTPGVHPNPCPLSRWCHLAI